MVSLSLAEAKDKRSAVVNDVTSTHERYTVTRHGRPVARAGPLVENPQRVGKQLISPPFQGDWSARRGHYRVRYQIDEEKHAITVIEIADRSDIHPGRT